MLCILIYTSLDVYYTQNLVYALDHIKFSLQIHDIIRTVLISIQLKLHRGFATPKKQSAMI